MSTAAKPDSGRDMPGPKEQFLDSYEREHEKTMRLLRAYPKDKVELKPHPKAKSARELAWMFPMETVGAEKALTGGFDWSQRPSFPPAPDSYEEIVELKEKGHRRIVELVRGMREDELFQTVQFPAGPKKMGEFPRLQFLWMMLCDEIHHRGQFSVYLRMADGKVPSIYGPSLDEPWS